MTGPYTRGQWWLITWGICALGLALCMLFTARVHWAAFGETRLHQLAPGEAHVTPEATMRLTDLEQTSTVGYFDDPIPVGAVLVIATFEAEVFDTDGVRCYLLLVQDDGRVWNEGRRVGDNYCPTEVTDGPVTFQVGYTVPEVALSRLAGVYLDADVGPGYLLTPSAD